MKILTVPWAVTEPETAKPFTETMEAASILCLADSERHRPRTVRDHGEEITYLSKLYYPFWAIPHNDGCIVIDGLDISSHTIIERNIPDIKSFTEDLKRASRDFNLYRRAIDRHIRTFKDFKSTSEAHIQALVGNKEILEVILQLLSKEMHSEEPQTEEPPLPLLRLDEGDATERFKGFLEVWKGNISDIEGLRYAINVLNEEMAHHKGKMMTEIEELQRQYEMRILELRPPVEKRINGLTKKKESKIKRTVKDQERRLRAAVREQEKLEREAMRLEKRIENYLARKRTLRGKDTSQLDEKIETCQGRIMVTAKRIEVISRIAETIRREGDETVKAIKDDYQRMIEKEREKIDLLETSMQAETSELKKEIEDIRAKASSVATQIEHLIERKKVAIDETRETTVPGKVEEVILIRIPFYVARYKARDQERLEMFPPVVADRRGGLILKLKRAIKPTLGSRIRLLLHPRWNLLEPRAFAKLEEKTNEDASLKEEVNSVMELNNLLEASCFTDFVVVGTRELKEEGWIKEGQRKEILDEYTS